MAQRRARPWIADQRLALFGGYGALVIGTLLLYDAYENRNARRPLVTKFIPGA